MPVAAEALPALAEAGGEAATAGEAAAGEAGSGSSLMSKMGGFRSNGQPKSSAGAAPGPLSADQFSRPVQGPV